MTWEPNAEQRAAIDARGRVFVSAGAGTGKTAVLVERFVEAVCDRGLDVESVLVITYTKRAAGELRARIRAELRRRGRADLARSLDGAYISTIHGFCNRLLKAYPFEAGLDPRFRELDDAQASVLSSEAFDEALDALCAPGDDEPARLLTTYGAAGLRRMITGIYDTLRSAGRELVLELGERPPVEERLEALREAARCLADDSSATELQRGSAAALLEAVSGETRTDDLLDLSAHRARGERAATYEEARLSVEQAALDQLAMRDRDLLQQLLDGFAEAYAAAKRRESALDFEDLQLAARALLRDHAEIREREALRFKAIMVDEFQDTNRLQCDLIDLLSEAPGEFPDAWGAAGALGPEGTVLCTGPESTGAPAASGADGAGLRPAGVGAGQAFGRDVFFVGDEFQSIYGFRHADVAVFRERREQAGGGLPLVQNYRSRPEVLEAVNYLFRGDFGEDFQSLHASGEFPDPVFGHPVELLVTDKSTYAGTGVHWRRAEARHVAGRVRDLIESGAATAGEIVLLFAAGTDAEWYEQELRALGIPTYRATGRGYFGQQQVVDLLGYLRLLQNRYDDLALVSVLASPFVGVSNDTLFLLRRAAGRRPIFAGLERSLPEQVAPEDERLLLAFKQRYDRLAAASSRLSLERLCEQILVEHDYDLAVLAHWDGRRRYANLRKLARLARAYEELRGRDIEGFLRFMRDQEAVGAKELEAVAEEEGADAVRLLTIHAAKGLEFKVVIVADAGRDRPPPGPDELLALSDGRFGFRVADPLTSRRRGVFDYEDVRRAREAEDRAERLRLYYVAMTRAIDRLIVSGAVDPSSTADASTPLGWALARLEAEKELEVAADGPVELERETARLLLRLDRFQPEAEAVEEPPAVAEDGQLALFAANGAAALPPPAPQLPALAEIPAPPLHAVRSLSYTALSLFDRCSYRYYAERVVGMRPSDESGRVPGSTGLAATEVGDAVHRLLELVDLSAPAPPDLELVRSWYPAVTDEELERIAGFVSSYCESELARRIAALPGALVERPFAFEQDGVLLHGRLDVLHRDGSRALVLDYKTNTLEEESPEEIVEGSYTLQRLVYAIACFRAGAEEVEVVYHFLERPDAVVSTTFARAELPELEAQLSAAIARIDAGDFRPTPGEVCNGCPALDLVCAGPRLPNARPQAPAAALSGA
ncbi:MAG TPA: UvrD-helicase domain-containing protein [Gaiellaceae bacterium]|nr:UvrD-helicase domain-containing protein [Gaiellaceae bacterium]